MPDNSASRKRWRVSGFTLVELMVTMAIMAVLASALAYVMAGAQESAQIAKTKSLIARLHALVMQKYESYRYRRLPVAIPAGLTPRQAAQVRCDVIRQLMRLEMPERWTDVADNAAPLNYTFTTAPLVMQRPACSQAYVAFYNSVVNTSAFQQHLREHEGAKCLYLLVTMGLDEPDVLENFSASDIGEFDATGCKVFLDAWGRPIEFLRWAPGFVSPLQPAPPTAAGGKDYRMPDQTDPLGVYGTPQTGSLGPGGSGRVMGNTFALYPLIYSAGPDGNPDLVPEQSLHGSFHYSAQNAKGPRNDPFASIYDTSNFVDGPMGTPFIPSTDKGTRSLGDSDNIYNHAIGQR